MLTLGDSAGVRDTDDFIEGAGINISFDEIKKSDLVILVFDEETEGSVSFFQELLGGPWQPQFSTGVVNLFWGG